MNQRTSIPKLLMLLGICRGIGLLGLMLSLFMSITFLRIISALMHGVGLQKGHQHVHIVAMYHFRLCLILCGIRIHHQSDPRQLRKLNGPILFVANHISYFDIIIIGSMFPTAFVAKKEMQGWPFFGFMATAMQAIFVKREFMPDRVRALLALSRNIGRISYCIFPEGITTASGLPSPHNWHDGSFFAAKRACQTLACLGLAYRDQEQIAWIDDMTLLGHLMKSLCRRRTEVFFDYSLIDMARMRFSEIREISRSARTVVTSLFQELSIREKRSRMESLDKAIGTYAPCVRQNIVSVNLHPQQP